MKPEHISAYMFSIESGTQFYKIYNKKNGVGFMTQDNIAAYYETLCRLLTGKGYFHYEISNFSKAGYESRHNINYWKRGEYLGLGPSASSFLKLDNGKEIRKTNAADLYKYADNILGKSNNIIHNPFFYNKKAASETDFIEILSENDKINEEIFLSLRTAAGISTKRLSELTGQEVREVINKFIKEGLMKNFKENITLTLKGMLLSSEIFARIMV